MRLHINNSKKSIESSKSFFPFYGFFCFLLIAIASSPSFGQTCSGNADTVDPQTTGVTNGSNTTGNPDTNFGQIWDTSDTLVLDLTDTLNMGEVYTLTWRRKSTYTNTDFADIVVQESLDGSTWTSNPTMPSTNSTTSFDNTNLTTTAPTRYIRIWTLTSAGDDVDFDGVAYTNVACGCSAGTVWVDAFQASCTNGVPNEDAQLVIRSAFAGTHYQFSTGSNYTNSANISDAIAFDYTTDLPLYFGTLANPSPSSSEDYTIRIFYGKSGCYTDQEVTLDHQDCVASCDCKEFVFLNEVNGGGSIHKFRVEDDKSFTEIGDPWFNNTTEGVVSPHGLGTDLNGYIYIAEKVTPSEIRRFNCDGDISPESDFKIAHDGLANISSIGNKLYINNHADDSTAILVYDLCTMTQTNSLTFCEKDYLYTIDWGFYIDPRTQEMYATASATGNSSYPSKYLWHFTEDDFDNDPNTCVSAVPLSVPFPDRAYLGGVTTDVDRNIYIVIRDHVSGTRGARIVKYGPAPNFNYIGVSNIDNTENGTGWNQAIGIVYSETSNRIYTSNLSNIEDCISAFDTSLTYLGYAVPPVPGATEEPKGIGIRRECCPSSNNMTVDTILCGVAVGDIFFLQHLTNCEGTVCGGLWTADVDNGIDYEPCDNSIEITSLDGCGSFTIESDGFGTNSQCGAFKITVNIQLTGGSEAKVYALQPTCNTDGSINTDGYLQISEITAGTRFNWSVGSTYTGDPDFADAIDTTGLSFPHIFKTGLSNPTTGSQDYTIRIFSDTSSCGGGCYTDYTVMMKEQDCEMGCECTEMIYMNEPAIHETLKFKINADGSLTEITSPTGGHWMSGLTEKPHGIGFDDYGNVYINNRDIVGGVAQRGVDKFSCDGTLIEADYFPPAPGNGTGGAAGYTANIYHIGNTMYMSNWFHSGYGNTSRAPIIFAYDICTQALLGQYEICGDIDFYAWDFIVEEETNRIIIKTEDAIAIGDLDTHLNGPCVPVSLTIGDQFKGIVLDDLGNYILYGEDNVLRKYNTTGTLLCSVDLTIDGGSEGLGLVYSNNTGYLYLGANDTDCIAVYDPSNCSYIMQGFPNPGGGDAKAVALKSECCPTNNNITVDTTFCGDYLNQQFFLQELINCSGTICEGIWDTLSTNNGIVYNSCDS